jgi:hypothetical protein
VYEHYAIALQRRRWPPSKCHRDSRTAVRHAALFPTGRSGIFKIVVGGWRTEQSGPTQVVSGPEGRQQIHFEAPAARRLENEMKAFLEWFNTNQGFDPLIKAALARLWSSILSKMDMGVSRAPLPISPQRDQNKVRSAPTVCLAVCLPKFAKSERPTTIFSKRLSTARSTSWAGWNGSSTALIARSTAQRR